MTFPSTLSHRTTVRRFCHVPLPVAALLAKILSNFRRNLAIRHLVYCFNADDAPAEFALLKTFLQLTLGLTRAKDQNGLCIANTRNYRVVVDVEMSCKLPLAAIICRHLL